MTKKNKKNYSLEGEVSFKQSWRIAHMFAEQCADEFSRFDHNQLAKLFNGSIYYYHQELGEPLSKEDASEIISKNLKCPPYYIDNLKKFLANENRFKKTPSNKNNEQEPDIDLLIAIAKQGA